MSINKPDHGAKKSNRNRDKSKSSDHYRQPYGQSNINDYDLVIDQEDVRPIADIDDSEESPQVMIISDNEQLRGTNYAHSMLHQPQTSSNIEMVAQEHNFVSMQGNSKSKLFAPLPQQPGMPMSPNQIFQDRESPIKMTKKPVFSKMKQAPISINSKSPTGYQMQTMQAPNSTAIKTGSGQNSLQTQKSYKRISGHGITNPAQLKNKPELLRLNEPLSKDFGPTSKPIEKGQKKKQSKKTINK